MKPRYLLILLPLMTGLLLGGCNTKPTAITDAPPLLVVPTLPETKISTGEPETQTGTEEPEIQTDIETDDPDLAVDCSTKKVVDNSVVDINKVRIWRDGDRTYFELKTSTSPSEGVEVFSDISFQKLDGTMKDGSDQFIMRVIRVGEEIIEYGILDLNTGEIDKDDIKLEIIDTENNIFVLSFQTKNITELGYFRLAVYSTRFGSPCESDFIENIDVQSLYQDPEG